MSIFSIRGIRRSENLYSRFPTTLCGACSNKNCQDFAAQACGRFIPTVTFKAPVRGIDGQFCTFRLGTSWYKLLEVNDIVGLSTTDGDFIGKSKVTGMDSGMKREMLQLHAKHNHSVLALNVDDPAQWLNKRLRQLYGLSYERVDTLSVIYLERIYDQPNEMERGSLSAEQA